MSKKRIRFVFGYLLFVLLLLVQVFFPWHLFTNSPEENWEKYHAWFGPTPAGLNMLKTHDAENGDVCYTFTFPSAPKTETHLINHFRLIPGASSPGAPTTTYHTQEELILLRADHIDWGYPTKGLTLTRGDKGCTSLVFCRPANIDGLCIDVAYDPAFEVQRDSQALIAIVLLFYLLSFFLLLPLGFLLLFPGFTLRRPLHVRLWYAAVVIPILLQFIAAHFVIHDPAIIGSFILLFPGTLFMLLGARLLLPLGKRIAQS